MTAFKIAVAAYAGLSLCAYVIKLQHGYIDSAPLLSSALGLWATFLLVA